MDNGTTVEMPAEQANTSIQLRDPRLDALATFEDCYEYIRTLGITEQYSRAYYNWHIGAAVHRVGELGADKPEAVTASKTGYKERHLRYCRSVAGTFTLDEVQRLVQGGGMQWATLRELASGVLVDVRPDLCAKFLNGELTDIEVRDQAKQCRHRLLEEAAMGDSSDDDDDADTYDGSESGVDDPDIRNALKSLKALVGAAVSALSKDKTICAEFLDTLKKELVDVLVEGTEVNPVMLSELEQVEKSFIESAVASLSACWACRIISNKMSYPFDSVETILREAKDLAEANGEPTG